MIRSKLVVVAVCALAGVTSAQDGELKWKLATGDVLVYDHVIEQKFKLASDESAFEYVQKIEASERLEVEKTTAEGNFQVKVTVCKVRVTVDGKVMFDSDAPEKGDPNAAAMFKQAIGQSQTFTMTPSGRLAGAKGTLENRMQQGFGGGSPIGAEGGLPMSIIAVPLPDAPLGANRSWSIDAAEENENGTKMISTSTYRVEGAGIKGETSLKLDRAPATMKLREGAGKQRATFDSAAGNLKESDLDFTVTLENVIEGKVVKVTNGMKSTTKLKERVKK